MELYPLILKPAYQSYLWGGKNIFRKFSRGENERPIAESWEVSDRIEGLSYIENGPYRGLSLKELMQQNSSFLLGYTKTRFPLLIKLIDAEHSLSFQVHPNQENAKKLRGEPKSEMWHILDHKKGACIWAGLKEDLSSEELQRVIEEKKLPDLLHKIEVKQGDTFWIPSGCIHAIGEGCLIYEVQENSNTTYRLFDWDRVDSQGKARALHLKEGIQACNRKAFPSQKRIPLLEHKFPFGSYERLLITPYFKVSRLFLEKSLLKQNPLKLFYVYFCLEGEVEFQIQDQRVLLFEGTTLLIPAAAPSFWVHPKKRAILLETHV